MISKRTLEKWRREALLAHTDLTKDKSYTHSSTAYIAVSMCSKIIAITQELLDQHLLKRGK